MRLFYMAHNHHDNSTRRTIPKAAYAPMLGLEAYTRTRVPRNLAHLVRLRASALNGCRYCLAMHRRDARRDGWSAARIAAAETWTEHAAKFGPGDQAVLEFTDAVTRIHGEDSVDDALWERLTELHGAKLPANLLMEVVTINAWNRLAITSRQDPASLRNTVEADFAPVPNLP